MTDEEKLAYINYIYVEVGKHDMYDSPSMSKIRDTIYDGSYRRYTEELFNNNADFFYKKYGFKIDTIKTFLRNKKLENLEL
jgi:hypothetical protein